MMLSLLSYIDYSRPIADSSSGPCCRAASPGITAPSPAPLPGNDGVQGIRNARGHSLFSGTCRSRRPGCTGPRRHRPRRTGLGAAVAASAAGPRPPEVVAAGRRGSV